MEPLICRGDSIMYSESGFQRLLKRGNIVVFKPENETENITHRIMSVRQNMLTTKGDSRKNIDRKIKINEVKGVVIRIIKDDKTVNLHNKVINRMFNKALYVYSWMEWKFPWVYRYMRGRGKLSQVMLAVN